MIEQSPRGAAPEREQRGEGRTVRRAAVGPTRRALGGAVVAAMGGGVMALAACGPLGGQPAGGKATASGPVTAKVLTFNNPLFQRAKDDLLDAAAAVDSSLQPDIIVFPGGIGQFRTKVLAMYAGGDLPDAQWVHPSITSLVGSRKLLRPLDEFARRDRSTPLADFYQGVLDYFRWRGKAYALPWYSPGWVFVFNRALFDRLGVTTPDMLEQQKKWTWDTFVSTLRSMTTGTAGSPDRTIGSDRHTMNLDWACSWIWRNGGRVFSKDGKTCVLNEVAAVEAIQGMADLHLKYQVINYGTIRDDFPEGFLSGRIGLRQANKERTAPERNDLSRATFALGMAPVYQGKAGRVNRMGTLGFGLAQGAPNGDAGWRWVRFMAGPQAAAILMRNKSTLPVRPQFAKLPEFAQSMAPWENKDVWLESQATARAMRWPASYNEIASLWSDTWNAILEQKGPTKSLLDDLVRQVNPLLAQE
ncbi:MAG: ABC transporter substrate-binding protein [Chloroflexota bacterium]